MTGYATPATAGELTEPREFGPMLWTPFVLRGRGHGYSTADEAPRGYMHPKTLRGLQDGLAWDSRKLTTALDDLADALGSP